MFFAQSTACIPTTSKNFDSLLNTHSIVEDCRHLGKMKLNEPGRQKLGKQEWLMSAELVSGHDTLVKARCDSDLSDKLLAVRKPAMYTYVRYMKPAHR